mmetsp:Transcript_28978/g.63410  ORF Transcript_28978/g.63410 Transcript_28978/m.63410 type:complete len:408 (-) Transcript_28978:369-1592(-)
MFWSAARRSFVAPVCAASVVSGHRAGGVEERPAGGAGGALGRPLGRAHFVGRHAVAHLVDRLLQRVRQGVDAVVLGAVPELVLLPDEVVVPRALRGLAEAVRRLRRGLSELADAFLAEAAAHVDELGGVLVLLGVGLRVAHVADAVVHLERLGVLGEHVAAVAVVLAEHRVDRHQLVRHLVQVPREALAGLDDLVLDHVVVHVLQELAHVRPVEHHVAAHEVVRLPLVRGMDQLQARDLLVVLGVAVGARGGRVRTEVDLPAVGEHPERLDGDVVRVPDQVVLTEVRQMQGHAELQVLLQVPSDPVVDALELNDSFPGGLQSRVAYSWNHFVLVEADDVFVDGLQIWTELLVLHNIIQTAKVEVETQQLDGLLCDADWGHHHDNHVDMAVIESLNSIVFTQLSALVS